MFNWKREKAVRALCQEWYKVPADVRIVMMQGAPQFYWQMAYLAARVTVEDSDKQKLRRKR